MRMILVGTVVALLSSAALAEDAAPPEPGTPTPEQLRVPPRSRPQQEAPPDPNASITLTYDELTKLIAAEVSASKAQEAAGAAQPALKKVREAIAPKAAEKPAEGK